MEKILEYIFKIFFLKFIQKLKMKSNQFSFNNNDVDVELLSIRKYISDVKEQEKIMITNESIHIDDIIDKSKNAKIHSALLKKNDKKIVSTQSEENYQVYDGFPILKHSHFISGEE